MEVVGVVANATAIICFNTSYFSTYPDLGMNFSKENVTADYQTLSYLEVQQVEVF